MFFKKIVDKRIDVVESFCVLKLFCKNIKNILKCSDSLPDNGDRYCLLIKDFLSSIMKKDDNKIRYLSNNVFNIKEFEDVCISLRMILLTDKKEKYISILTNYFKMSILEFQNYLNIKEDFCDREEIFKNLENCLIEIDRNNKLENHNSKDSFTNETQRKQNQYDKEPQAIKQTSNEIKTENTSNISDALTPEHISRTRSVITVSEPKIFELLPQNVINDVLRFCNYTYSFDKNNQEEIHTLLEKNEEFIGAFLTNQESFCYYLQNKLAIDISEKNMIDIYNELKNKWNKNKSIPPVTHNGNCWISNIDLLNKKDVEYEYKYLIKSTEKFKDYSPYFIKSSQFTYNNHKYGKCRIIHYSNKETMLKYMPKNKNEFDEIEYLLNDVYDKEENKNAFEQLIKDNNVMFYFTKLYDAVKYKEDVRKFFLNKLFKNRGYDLVSPDDHANICEVKYETISEEALDGKSKENIYGLKKATTILIDAQRLIYRYDSTYFLKVFISEIKAIKSYSATFYKLGKAESIINSLMKNIDLINQNNIAVMDGKQKKSWILSNGTMSVFFEIDPEQYMNEIKNSIANDPNLYKQISIHTEKFIKEWNKYLKILNNYGIKRIESTIDKTKVTLDELNKGWEVSNPEIIYTDIKDKDMQVREIIQYGIEVDDIIIRKHIVKTYIYK